MCRHWANKNYKCVRNRFHAASFGEKRKKPNRLSSDDEKVCRKNTPKANLLFWFVLLDKSSMYVVVVRISVDIQSGTSMVAKAKKSFVRIIIVWIVREERRSQANSC